jgi:2-keto-3-deoxy-L-rhamnonate aldolase RhmA
MPATVTLTLAEAAQVLDPPMTEQQLRAIVRALRWEPEGYRHTGRAGRPGARYDAGKILKLHAALVPFLGNNVV